MSKIPEAALFPVRLRRLADLVRARRGQTDLRDAAKQADVSAATLSRVERCEVPSVETLLRLCEWMGIGPNEALGWTERGYVEPSITGELLAVQAQLLSVSQTLNGAIEMATREPAPAASAPEAGGGSSGGSQ